jgi:hypothetical protein
MSDDDDRRLLPAERWSDHELPLLDMDPEAAEAMRAALVNPNNRACDARAELIELAKDARITELAVEAAYSAGVRNSIERMLVHQMALAHKHAFMMGRKLQAALANAHSDDSANLRATRLATAMARLMGAYQQGTTTLQRLRSGGQQTVVVQHVQVNDGGQAIVAGKVKAGGIRKRAGGGGGRK